jgi:hypothetical protein
MNKHLTTSLVAVFALLPTHSVRGASTEFDPIDQPLTISQLQKYLSSSKISYRERAVRELWKHDAQMPIDRAPVRVLSSMLLKGFSDPAASVRFATVAVTGSQADRIGICADAPRIEKVLQRLSDRIFKANNKIKDETLEKDIEVRAFITLLSLKYERLTCASVGRARTESFRSYSAARPEIRATLLSRRFRTRKHPLETMNAISCRPGSSLIFFAVTKKGTARAVVRYQGTQSYGGTGLP